MVSFTVGVCYGASIALLWEFVSWLIEFGSQPQNRVCFGYRRSNALYANVLLDGLTDG